MSLRSMRPAICVAAALSAAIPVCASAEETYLGVLGNYMVVPDDRNRAPALDDGYGIDIRYGSGRRLFGMPLEYRAFYDQLNGSAGGDGFQGGVGADLLYPFGDLLPNTWGLSPFAIGGIGGSMTDAVPGGDDEFGFLANAGAGLTWGVLGNWRLRGEVRYVYQSFEGGYVDLNTLLGLEIPLGETMAEPAAEPVRVVATGKPQADSDGDGVADSRDACPGTPAGERVDASGCPPAKVLTLKGVTFALNSDQLEPESFGILDSAAQTLTTEYPNARIEVAGHTDSSGDASYNEDLSRRRAETVRGYLIERGVEAARLTAVGYGPTQPVATNDSAEGRAQNRRVELRVRGK